MKREVKPPKMMYTKCGFVIERWSHAIVATLGVAKLRANEGLQERATVSQPGELGPDLRLGADLSV